MTAPKRRWFHISLAAMFVVAALCCWLGYQWNWIRQRHSVLARDDIRSSEQWFLTVPDYFPKSPNPPWPLSVLGEKGYGEVVLVHLDDERERIANPPENAASRISDAPPRDRIPRPMLPTWQQRTAPLLRPDERSEIEQLKRLFPESNVSIDFR